jgi:hypothetical protein
LGSQHILSPGGVAFRINCAIAASGIAMPPPWLNARRETQKYGQVIVAVERSA